MLKHKNLIFLGAPGAGKGTFSQMLLEREKLAHISTGDILRAEIASGSELGSKAKGLMDAGELVPDSLVGDMVDKRLRQSDCDNGFILDGFPRTLEQAHMLEKMSRKVDAVIYFNAGDELLLKRLTARVICKKCGRIYNKLFGPPKVEGICDDCGGEIYQRSDDSPETAAERLRIYHEQTQALIDYYRQQGLLLEVKEPEKNAAFARLMELIGR